MLHLITRLETLVGNSLRIPFSSKVLVDADEFLDIIDQIRVALPEEIRQAKKLVQEKEKLLAEARAEGEKVLEEASQKALTMVEDNEIARDAAQRAQEIVSQAERRGVEIRLGADNYARDVLTNLENELNRLLVTVRRGKTTLEKGAEAKVLDDEGAE